MDIVENTKRLYEDINNSVEQYNQYLETDIKQYCTGIHDALRRYQQSILDNKEPAQKDPVIQGLRVEGDKAMRAIYTRYCNILTRPEVENRIQKAIENMEAKYGTCDRTISTNLGDVRMFVSDSGRVAIKKSRISYNVTKIVDDPRHESRWYKISCKDAHPCMIPCIETFALGKYFYSITNEAVNGDLFRFLTNPATDKRKVKNIYMDLLYTMLYLHDHMRSAHLDLKPENVFLGENDQVMLGDFGVAMPVGVNPDKYQSVEYLTNVYSTAQIAPFAESGSPQEVIGHVYDESRRMFSHIHAALKCGERDFKPSLRNIPMFTLPIKRFLVSPALDPRFLHCILDSDGHLFDKTGLTRINLFNSFRSFVMSQNPVQKMAIVNICRAVLTGDSPPSYFVPETRLSAIPSETLRGARGTSCYMCPQLLQTNKTLPFAADVYSLGVILFICVTSFPPYKEMKEKAFQELHVKGGGVRHLLQLYGREKNVDSNIIDVLEAMMHRDPLRRPSVAECIERLVKCDFEVHYRLNGDIPNHY